MPSTLPLHTIAELQKAFHDGVKATQNARADGHDGSAYDYIAGLSAIIWSRLEQLDRDRFRANYFGLAESDDLTNLVSLRYGIDRVLDSYGTGFATLSRPSAGTADKAWTGTRIRAQSPDGLHNSVSFAVTADTAILSTSKVAIIPIRATVFGSGQAYNSSQQSTPPILDDALTDTTWAVSSLICGDGTDYEPAPALRGRVRDARRLGQVGYKDRITQACIDAGAVNVAAFDVGFGGIDLGECAVYVGDSGFSGSTKLVNACKVRLESYRVAGADMHVGAMVTTPLSIVASVSLWDEPAAFDVITLKQAMVIALQREFSRTDAYGFDIDTLAGVLSDVSDSIQSVNITSPSASAGVLVSGRFPFTLPRYTVSPTSMSLTVTGPQ
jgi:hypothetical protein